MSTQCNWWRRGPAGREELRWKGSVGDKLSYTLAIGKSKLEFVLRCHLEKSAGLKVQLHFQHLVYKATVEAV